jgi:hypothetical protein
MPVEERKNEQSTSRVSYPATNQLRILRRPDHSMKRLDEEPEDVMTSKITVGVLLIAALSLPNAASAAGWTRGQCIDAVHQRLGTRSADSGHTLDMSAVRRCIKFGPGAID